MSTRSSSWIDKRFTNMMVMILHQKHFFDFRSASTEIILICEEVENMDHSSIVVITGANSGRGKAIAIELAKTGAVIVMVWRSKERGEVALQDVRNLSGNKIMQVLSCLDIIKQPMDMNFILELITWVTFCLPMNCLTSLLQVLLQGLSMFHQVFITSVGYILACLCTIKASQCLIYI